MEVQAAIKEITDQWAILLTARICNTLQLPPNELQSRLENTASRMNNQELGAIIRKGLKMSTVNDPNQINIMSDTVGSLLMQFHCHPNFCKIFNTLMNSAHELLNMPLQTETTSAKPKALHTDKIINDEVLTDFEKLECNVFDYISHFLLAAANCESISFDPISLDIVSIIFHYLKHEQPNAVRASAGDILSALSSSPRHCQIINDMFWQQFGLCKKDDDFRNFASWIDGVQNLKLALTPEPLEKVTLQFFQNFIDNEKKIERGVLRMKFLDAFLSILKNNNKTPASAKHEQYYKHQEAVWNIALKWSSKSKHTSFCYTFLCHLISSTTFDFYLPHAKQYCELLTKYAKSGEVDMLTLIADFIKTCPADLYKTRVDEFTTMVNTHIIPLLFAGTDKKRTLRFTDNEQIPIVFRILTEIGVKQMNIIVDFVRPVLSVEEPNSDTKRVRLICIQVLAELSTQAPQELVKFNEVLFPLLQPSILGVNPEFKEEIQYAIPTFPLIHSINEEKLDQLAEVVFNLSILDDNVASSAMNSMNMFIQNLVSLKLCARAPIIYINKIIEIIHNSKAQDVLHYLCYLSAVINSWSNNISDAGKIELTGSKLQPSEWREMRLNLDVLMLIFLLSPEKSLSANSHAVLKCLNLKPIQDFDRECNYTYSFAKYVSEVAGSDYIGNASKMVESGPDFSANFFIKILQTWEKQQKTFEANHSTKIMDFLASIVRKNDENFKKFIGDIFMMLAENPSSNEAIHALGLIDYSLAAAIAGQIDTWATQNNRKDNYYPQTITILSTISSRPQFAKLQEGDNLIPFFENFVRKITSYKAPNSQERYINLERSLKVFIVFAAADPNHLSNVINKQELVEKFIKDMIAMASLDCVKQFTNTFPETFLTALKTSFEFINFPINLFDEFSRWLMVFTRIFSQKEQIQTYIVQALTTLLHQNFNILYPFLQTSYGKFDLLTSHIILAIANVFSMRNDFLDKYENGDALLLVTVILHISSVSVLSRQAAHKLLCLLLTKERSIFTKSAPRTLVMATTSHSPSGFITQAAHFVNFASKAVTPQIAREFFKIFADDFDKIEQSQNPLLSSIYEFIPVILEGCEATEVLSAALHLTSHCKLNESSTAAEVTKLWHAIFENFKQNKPDVAKTIVKLVFDNGVSQEKLSSIETQTSVLVLVSLFQVFPHETGEFILPILSIYDRSIPDDIDAFVTFLKDANITFVPSKEEIVAANALSQILLLISDRSLFEEIFQKKLAPLLFFATINYHLEEFSIGPFRPLLDSLLDAGLFRFARDSLKFSENLAALQKASLINCATSLEQQFQIITVPPAKKMLAYDNEAVLTMCTLMCQNDPEFKQQFFNLILANAVQVKEGDRSVEPLIMMIALKDEMNTRSIYFLLLFTLYALKNNRTELMDALVDNIHHRLISEKCDKEAFSREAVPVAIIFLLYITIDCKRSFSIHLMKILTDVCRKISEGDDAKERAAELNAFFEQYSGDEYISSLFIHYVADLPTLGDDNVKVVVECLYQLNNVISKDGKEINWCFLLAILIDAVRTNIAVMSNRPIPAILNVKDLKYNPIDFAEYFLDKFKDTRMRMFYVLFMMSLYKTFKCNDVNKDAVVMSLLAEFVGQSKLVMAPNITDSLLKTAALVNLTADVQGREEASKLLYTVINSIQYKPSESALSVVAMKPQIVPVQRKMIGHWQAQKGFGVSQANFPHVVLYNIGAMENTSIIDMMWEYIVKKSNQ